MFFHKEKQLTIICMHLHTYIHTPGTNNWQDLGQFLESYFIQEPFEKLLELSDINWQDSYQDS